MKVETEIYNFLLEIGCCKPCCLRYISNRSADLENAAEYFIKNNFESAAETVQKKLKTNPCVICLGLLQDVSLDEIISHPDLSKVQDYDSETFTCAISMPACIMLREKCVRACLEDKFPKYFTEDKEDIYLNKAWKMVVKDKLGRHINKKFEISDICEFCVNIVVDYEKNVEEVSAVREMQPKMFEDRKNQHRKFNGELYSRKAVQTALERTPSGILKMHAKIPPEIPDTSVKCVSVECKHNPIYFAGRYCKYSRELSQSPWIIDGVKTMETSVQEIIFKELNEVFGINENNIRFSSSGREDCDVRCLGKGRPFYLEILDPKKTKYAAEDFKKLQNTINLSNLIQVRDLQLVHKSELGKIKLGEESKTKQYNALCISKTEITQAQIDKLNSIEEVVLKQKTPIRVLHRRPLAVRERKIYKITAKKIADNEKLFELNMVTQAGTYVKEFVHGDFGRTKPSVGDIVNADVDILALDVVSIDLDWPKEIFYD